MITRILFITILATLFNCHRSQQQLVDTSPATSQQVEAPEEPRIPESVPVEQIIEEAGKYVTLSEEQKLEIYQLADQYNYDRLSPQEQKAKRQELREEVITNILTPEQRRSVRAAMRDRRQ